MTYTVATPADTAVIENEMDVLERWNEKTVYEQLCKTSKKFPTRPAVSFQLKSGMKDKSTTLSWNELMKKVTQAANLFRSMGIGQNDVDCPRLWNGAGHSARRPKQGHVH